MDRMLSMMSSEREDNGVFAGDMLHRELLAVTMDKAQEKGQKLSIDLSVLKGMELEADYAALCRLLTNLLSNAIKYTQAGGEITLRAQIETRWPVRSRVRFVVADNGMGMTKAFMRRMFEPYARARETEYIAGKGLGLVVVRDMAKRLGGSIRVHSEWGKGTIFVVNVPIVMRMSGYVS